jgi:hypothetical protein
MRLDKEKALELRREGKSYREIRAALGIPMSTLSKWFSGSEWSIGLRQKLVRDGASGRAARMRELNQVRGTRLARLYEQGREEARKEWAGMRHDPLFIAGLSLYWAGGDRTTKEQVRFSTADMDKAKFFMEFLKRPCGVPLEKIRASLTIYPGQDEQSNRRFWAFALGSGLRFTKSAVVPGPHSAQKLRYGICTLTVSSAYLKMKMQEWLKILPAQLIERP